MAILMLPAKRIKKARSYNGAEVLKRLQSFLNNNTENLVQILCGFWEDQQYAISYQELREAVKQGYLDEDVFRQWSQDYSRLVATEISRAWMDAIVAGPSGQPVMDGSPFVYDTQTPGILSWISEHGAEFVTSVTQDQKDAISALLTKRMRDGHTVDELSRLIRPCIGLTQGQTKATANYYDSIVENLKKEHPRMKRESIRKKAQDAALKYAEKQHRYRALTIAQTEMAFAYNRGADESVRQAQAQGLMGEVRKRWCSSGDMSVCDTCDALDGTEIGMDEEFGFGGRALFRGHKLLPPAHPRCGCGVEYIEVSPPEF